MAYYYSLGKLLDQGYRFNQVWSGDNAVNVAINGDTYGFKIGDIILFATVNSNSGVNGYGDLVMSKLYFQGTKCLFADYSTSAYGSSVPASSWWHYPSSMYYIYIGLVTQTNITLTGSISGSPKSRLYKISDRN